MGLLNHAKFCACLVLFVLYLSEAAVYVKFDRVPPPRTRFDMAVFMYSLVDQGGRNPCKDLGCSWYCEIDGETLNSCSTGLITLKNLTVNYNHHLLISVTTSSGERNSSTYNWYIDTTPPTASVVTGQGFTNATKITVDITFTEACPGLGGFKCLNSSSCDLMVKGPASVSAQTLKILKPDIRYSLDISLSMNQSRGQVLIIMKNSFCTDEAGNLFTRANHPVLVHFDRRPLYAELWTSIPSYQLDIRGAPRTVFATNKAGDLKFFWGFNSPIANSTKDIMNVLDTNSGYFTPIFNESHRNKRFAFELRNVSRTEIITVKLQTASLIGISGTAVSPFMPLTFLYDSTKPKVVLRTNSPAATKEPSFDATVEFTKPVFGFEASHIVVDGGRVARFNEISKALYSVTIQAESQNVVSVHVLNGRVKDITGNLNSASNQLEVRHYSAPTSSVSLHSFVTAGLLTTSLAASIVALSTANLAAVGGVNSGVADVIFSDPSRNLLGMIGHLQVFALSGWFLAGVPIEYSETLKGLRWLIPHETLPWKKRGRAIMPHNPFQYNGPSNALLKCGRGSNSSEGKPSHSSALNSLSALSLWQQQMFEIKENRPEMFTEYADRCDHISDQLKMGLIQMLHREPKGNMINTTHRYPLKPEEYFIYFLGGKPLSAANVIRSLENYKGWQDLEMNLFWLGLGGGALLALHLIILLFLRWRTRASIHGPLCVPRFEIFLLVLMLPCIGQSSAFVIRGGTTGGIVAGVLLLAVPTSFILSILLFQEIAIFMGGVFQYKEVRRRERTEPWNTKLSNFFLGRSTAGKWFHCEGTPSSFIHMFGILFEDRKGPPIYVKAGMSDLGNMPKWTESGESGIGRMRALNTDGGTDDSQVPTFEWFLGCGRSAYVVLDLLRRVGLGVISGAYSSPGQSQCILAFSVTSLQFLYIFILKPYISRGVHAVECVSLLCEAGIFMLSFCINRSDMIKEQKILGLVMLVLLFASFVSQLVNEWYAMIKCLLRLPQSQEPSLKLGMVWVWKGLVLPFLPKKYWCKLVPASAQPKTGLAQVVHLSGESEPSTQEAGERHVEPLSLMYATVVPMASPDMPQEALLAFSGPAQVSRTKKEENKCPKESRWETKNEMKKLRELARASFSGRHRKSEDSSGRKDPKEQPSTEESSSYESAASS